MLSKEELNRCNDEGGCPYEGAFYGQKLSVGVQVFFGIAFLVPFVTQLGWGLKGRMWSFTLWMTLGIGFEVVGYLARTYQARKPFSITAYAAEFITLLLAPTFLVAAVSVSLKDLVLYYDPRWSLIKPKLYPLVFVGTDFISIFIQLVGAISVASAVASGGGNKTVVNIGDGAVLSGVIFQVINMLACATLMLLYAQRRKTAFKSGKVTRRLPQPRFPMDNLNDAPQMGRLGNDGGGCTPTPAISEGCGSEQARLPEGSPRPATEERRTKMFVWALMIAYTLIIIRCTYR